MEKEIKITPPEGFEIDKEHSTFDCIRFKPIEKKRWRDNEKNPVAGFSITQSSEIYCLEDLGYYNTPSNYNVFAIEKQVKSALAMARISQIMANDERFGGVVTDEEWYNADLLKYVIERVNNKLSVSSYWNCYCFLAFHTAEQRELFLQENKDLVRDYYMIG